MKTLKTYQLLGTAGLIVATALGSAAAQTTPAQTSTPQSSTAQTGTARSGSTNMSPRQQWLLRHRQAAREQQSTRKASGDTSIPWPARSGYIASSIRSSDRTNELDELQAKNANDIKDVDARATAGISKRR